MEHEFWHQKWQKNEIGFHLSAVNPFLVSHFACLSLPVGARVLLPLCGKTLDIAWLLSQGYRVVGIELSLLAIEDLFNALNISPIIEKLEKVTHYRAANLDIFVGDIFDVSPSMVGEVDAVYDRAALVALPESMRPAYTAHVMALSRAASQLLICFEYEQSLHAGPPFAIGGEEVKQHYQAHYQLIQVASTPVAGGLKGKCPAIEHVWYLQALK